MSALTKAGIKQIKKHFGTCDPKIVSFRTIENVINSSMSYIDKKEMITFLKERIAELEK